MQINTISGGSISVDNKASCYTKKQCKQVKIPPKEVQLTKKTDPMTLQSDMAAYPVHYGNKLSVDKIKQFLIKKPPLPEIMEFIEQEAQRIASERKNDQGELRA